MMADPRVTTIRSDLCRHGMTGDVPGGDGEKKPVMKPTGFMTSAWKVAEELELRCDGSHEHVHLQGAKMTQKAAVYPDELCAAIVRGVVQQQRYEKEDLKTSPRMGRNEIKSLIKRMCQGTGMTLSSMVSSAKEKRKDCPGVYRPNGDWNDRWIDKVHHEGLTESEASIHQLGSSEKGDWAVDDVTGMPLDADLVKEARTVEMSFFKKMRVTT